MPDTASLLAPLSAPSPASGSAAGAESWRAELTLGYEYADGRSTLARRIHRGPLRVQKPLYPEGDAVCHTIIVHPPGGIAGGDCLQLDLSLGEGSHALVTTPGASKWYKANGREATLDNRLMIGDHALLEWLPQETIVYDGARVRIATDVELAAGARYFGWEITVLGRRACGERFNSGDLRQQTTIRRAGREIFCEYAHLAGNDPLLASPVGLAGHHVMGTLLAAGKACPDEVLAACREVVPDDGARYGLTRLPGALAARYLGSSPQAARAYFTALWLRLRPWLAGREACIPRIWHT